MTSLGFRIVRSAIPIPSFLWWLRFVLLILFGVCLLYSCDVFRGRIPCPYDPFYL